MKRFFKENWLVIVTGIVVGAAALLLQALGNPKNMGFCIACFERDIVGAVGLHSAAGRAVCPSRDHRHRPGLLHHGPHR